MRATREQVIIVAHGWPLGKNKTSDGGERFEHGTFRFGNSPDDRSTTAARTTSQYEVKDPQLYIQDIVISESATSLTVHLLSVASPEINHTPSKYIQRKLHKTFGKVWPNQYFRSASRANLLRKFVRLFVNYASKELSIDEKFSTTETAEGWPLFAKQKSVLTLVATVVSGSRLKVPKVLVSSLSRPNKMITGEYNLSSVDRCRNSDIRERCDLKEDVVIRIEKDMLWWFDHLERMKESGRYPKRAVQRARMNENGAILTGKLAFNETRAALGPFGAQPLVENYRGFGARAPSRILSTNNAGWNTLKEFRLPFCAETSTARRAGGGGSGSA
ncbi:hypothetical protein EVAR_94299_1 [Eumeta japonica]|uniref:Uncharacterized protein n=1 Tax=Eumeta variegata TaxID=151549 RepID=A0A4C1UGG1_EUMVA|nr:hypothetical protein EVAR_94299_1 [Eumeta japonica]